jgi:hypothetical protein
MVEQADETEIVVVLGNKDLVWIARNDIAFNQQNLRWEYRLKSHQCLRDNWQCRRSQSPVDEEDHRRWRTPVRGCVLSQCAVPARSSGL